MGTSPPPDAWREAGPRRHAEDLVFVDECGVATNMARRYGRAEGGQRARARVPARWWERLTGLGGLSLGGLTACLGSEGATDRELMRDFVRHALMPTRRARHAVVLDNLSAHRDAEVRRLVEAAGCTLLFLPP